MKNKKGELVDITDKEEMEQVIQETNEQKYRQTENTPFMTSPLHVLKDFGYLGIVEAAKMVLDGTYQHPEDPDKYAALVLN